MSRRYRVTNRDSWIISLSASYLGQSATGYEFAPLGNLTKKMTAATTDFREKLKADSYRSRVFKSSGFFQAP